jgi:hypothetical protein
MKLSKTLQPILDLEVQLGNSVAHIEEPAGTTCPYAVVLKNPLHIKEINDLLGQSSSVEFWESRDPHYPIESGYLCPITRHVVSGPLS